MSSIQNRLKRLEGDSDLAASKTPRRVISLVRPQPDGPIDIMCIEVNGAQKSAFQVSQSYRSQADLLSAAEAAHLDIHGKPWPKAEMEEMKARSFIVTTGNSGQNP